MAHKLRNEFAKANLRSSNPRYEIALQTGPDTLTLEMAIVELNPTSPKGNAVKIVMKFVVRPLTGLGGIFTTGNMVIADIEADKMTFYSARDFKPYVHSISAMRKWAEQFELMTRTPISQTIKNTHCITLMPYRKVIEDRIGS